MKPRNERLEVGMSLGTNYTWAAIAEDLVAIRSTYARLRDAAESGAWQDAIRLTLFDRLHCLGQRLTLLVDQARTLRAFDGRGFDLGFEQWATDVRWISVQLEHPFDIDVDDTEEGEPLPGIADVDEVLALLDRLKPAP